MPQSIVAQNTISETPAMTEFATTLFWFIDFVKLLKPQSYLI
tara:strand:+ start:208 stop:333 length:126 start_codon:yes stop_codon:yes gene_type:complete